MEAADSFGSTRHVRASRPVAYLVLVAWASLLATWAVANPPFAAPDEEAHYLRTVGLSEAQTIGREDPSAHVGVSPTQIAWMRRTLRVVQVPPGLDPRPFSCQVGYGGLSAACLNSARPNRSRIALPSAVGNYQPLPYLLPSIVMRADGFAPGALRLARAAAALMVIALLAVALFAVYDGASPVLSIVGLLLAVTPMTIFCGASLSGSGLEIASGIAFLACLLRLTRPAQIARRWWGFTALCGAILALSRSPGPLWVGIALCVSLLAAEPGTALARWRQRGAWGAGAAVAVAVGLNLAWESRYGSHLTPDVHSLFAGVAAGAHEWWKALPETVGTFGYANVELPAFLPIVWLALTLGAILAAGRRGRKEMRLMVWLAAAALVLPAIFYAVLLRPTGFGLQGRHLLPALVALPLVAGEIGYRYRERTQDVGFRLLTLGVPLGVGVVQAGAWWVNARRFAVGNTGSFWFLGGARWSPPGSWVPWTIVVGFAALSLAVLPAVECRMRHRAGHAGALDRPHVLVGAGVLRS